MTSKQGAGGAPPAAKAATPGAQLLPGPEPALHHRLTSPLTYIRLGRSLAGRRGALPSPNRPDARHPHPQPRRVGRNIWIPLRHAQRPQGQGLVRQPHVIFQGVSVPGMRRPPLEDLGCVDRKTTSRWPRATADDVDPALRRSELRELVTVPRESRRSLWTAALRTGQSRPEATGEARGT